MLEIWQEVHSYYPIEASHIKSKTIWNNCFIKDVQGPMPVNQKWVEAGIWTIGDLVENNNFMSPDRVSDKFGISCTFLDLLAIRQRLPSFWKEIFPWHPYGPKEDPPGIYLNSIDNSSQNISCMKASTIYWNIIAKKNYPIPSVKKWISEFPGIFSINSRPDDIWDKIYPLYFRVQREVKVQSLQYKLLHWIIPCNAYLHKSQGVQSM